MLKLLPLRWESCIFSKLISRQKFLWRFLQANDSDLYDRTLEKDRGKERQLGLRGRRKGEGGHEGTKQTRVNLRVGGSRDGEERLVRDSFRENEGLGKRGRASGRRRSEAEQEEGLGTEKNTEGTDRQTRRWERGEGES